MNEDLSDKDPQKEEPNVHGKRNEEAGEDDDILISKIMNRIVESVSKP